ncbi:triose-phosphate isomerase [Marinobacterium lutimaris]|uniref:Triosephosphate isomerase n=1 Tax=Marinobacterium lutimaris TaxID=568106 RepID=A0A1H6D5G2_9GAMM|nr:triose-phosphate isomerase [Marinobacterium lutimaris]SEG80542.1 triosephosphate isomerase [Marinobacterium lutimaris]
MRKALVAGNWKMNGRAKVNGELVAQVLAGLDAQVDSDSVDVMVFPPSLYISQVKGLAGKEIGVGAQNLCEFADGAFTGELSAGMLSDAGCNAVLVGHSERRSMFGDSDARVAAKVKAALAADLTPVLCLGESLEQRDSGEALNVVAEQLRLATEDLTVEQIARLVFAYEPVWAIGTGRTATPEQAQEVHAYLRGQLQQVDAEVAAKARILYGGSCNPANAAELFAQADIDGGLIGGASLKANDFVAICQAAGAR